MSNVISICETTEVRSTAGVGAMGGIELTPGAMLSGRFEIGGLLGRGGMGSVFGARDMVTGRDIAIKVLLPDLTASQAARERFLAEAVVCCDLSHPNIVRVYDVGVSGEYLYFSMERLRGQTLRARMSAPEQGPLPLATVAAIARQVIEALQYTQRRIVHRDIKPENTWLCEDGTVKLMDFGIARAQASSALTKTGVTMGTPYYVAPEQWTSAKHVDWRADQYSLGVVLYELLTGSLPMGVFKPLSEVRRDLPRRFGRAVMRTMAARPEERWQSWSDLLAELVRPEPKPARTAIAMGTALAIVVAAAGLYWSREQPAVLVETVTQRAVVAENTAAQAPAVDKSVAGTVPISELAPIRVALREKNRAPSIAAGRVAVPATPERVVVRPKSSPGRPLTQPEYPPASRRSYEEGTVVLRLRVLADGSVAEARIKQSSGYAGLDAAALSEARRSWRFEPGTENGKPVAMWEELAVVFRLQAPAAAQLASPARVVTAPSADSPAR